MGYSSCVTNFSEPSKPSLLRAANSNKTSLTVAWSAPEQPNGPIDGYNVIWTNEKGALSADVGQALSYAIPDLQPYTEYDVEVLAFNRRDSKLLIGPPAKLLVRTKPDGKYCFSFLAYLVRMILQMLILFPNDVNPAQTLLVRVGVVRNIRRS